MKPSFAVFESSETETRQLDRSQWVGLVFKVRDETGKIQKLQIDVSKDLKEIIKVSIVNILNGKKIGVPVLIEPWHANLFKTWKESKDLLIDPDKGKKRVLFFDGLNWNLSYSPDLNVRFFCENKPDSFFSVSPTYKPYSFDNEDKSSCFSDQKIEKIVNRINELETERRSFWSLNIDRKLQKIEGLKWLVENSKNKTETEGFDLINTARKIPGMIEGSVYTRTKDLLDFLELPDSSVFSTRYV